MSNIIPSIIILLYIAYILGDKGGEDYYKILNVSRDANAKEIRSAFKKLAVKLHPDKNKEENADKKFQKITRAYEVLKDPESRKKYDIYGDAPFSSYKYEYQSYNFYQNEFGIYDDDPLVVTLSEADYELNVLDANQIWFVNFYSPNCHHCHNLAPTWRRLASELEGVVRVAAVNCADDWMLCHKLMIESYPTLMLYEKETHLHDGQQYHGPRTLEALEEFAVSKISVEIETITKKKWEASKDKNWLLFFCSDDIINCPDEKMRLKLASIVEGLMSVGIVSDDTLADELYGSHKLNPIVYWEGPKKGMKFIGKMHSIEGSDTQELVNNILKLLPTPKELTDGEFQKIRTELRSHLVRSWLICFYMGLAADLNLQLKRLPILLPNISIGLVHCGKNAGLCGALHVPRYPAWGILKGGGAFELHSGRDVLYEVVTFARDSVKATNLHALSPADFNTIINGESAWFVDWYAPWCPPCRKLMPELRKASQKFDPSRIQFGTVDCTLHRGLCQQEGITSYPTTRIYNGSNHVQTFSGILNEEGIVDFVNDLLNPKVILLTPETFHLLKNKPQNEIWIVDYFAPWCAPCQKLAPQWRKLAKQIEKLPEIKVAQVDCVANSAICSSQNVRGYPSIRLYPLGSKGLNTVAMYNGNRDVVSLKRWVLNFLPSAVMTMSAADFQKEIMDKELDLPWLIDFYAPWCGHCVHFEPEYREVAQALEGIVKAAKVDCEAERRFCGGIYVNQYPTLRLYFSSNHMYEISIRDSVDIVDEVKTIIGRKKSRHDEL